MAYTESSGRDCHSMTSSITASVTFEISAGEAFAPYPKHFAGQALHFFESGDDVTGAHALGIEKKNFAVHRGKTALMLFYPLRFKAA